MQEEVNRTLEQVKPQIVARLSREKKSKEFDEWLKKLKDSASVTVDDKALDADRGVAGRRGAGPSHAGDAPDAPAGPPPRACPRPPRSRAGDPKAGPTPAPASKQ